MKQDNRQVGVWLRDGQADKVEHWENVG